jgi:hypothetical protein
MARGMRRLAFKFFAAQRPTTSTYLTMSAKLVRPPDTGVYIEGYSMAYLKWHGAWYPVQVSDVASESRWFD